MTARLALGLVFLIPVQALAADEVPVLVELFTSEGCSSCPPADALLARLATERFTGARVVALSEHVDYWDDLGWRDRFSSPALTRRQEAYARRMGLSGVYTPQLVVAGRVQAVGGDERAARTAIGSAARVPGGRIAARLVRDGPEAGAIDVDAQWAPGTSAEVLVALVQDRATTRVERGENAGRTLAHASVVRSLTLAGKGIGAFRGRAGLPRQHVAEADRAVVVVQEPDGGPVRAVATVELR